MRTNHIFSLVLAVLVLTSSMAFAQSKQDKNKVVFDVNMHCGECQKKIEKNIAFEKGVKAMEVSLENKTVALTYDAAKTSPEKLQAALVKLGYTATAKDCTAQKAACCKETAAAPGECKDKAASCKETAAAPGECKDKAACCDKAAKADCKDTKADCKNAACSDKAKTAEATSKGCCADKKKA